MSRLENCAPGGKAALIAAYFLIYVVWGSTYYFIGVALRGFPPFTLGGVRFAAAGLILLCICALKGEDVFNKSLIKKSAVSGAVLLFIDMAVIMLAQKYVTSAVVAIVASSTAIWIMALDAPMWKENFGNPRRAAGMLAGFLGVAALFWERAADGEGAAPGEAGIAILIFGCVSWALGTLYAKYKSSRGESAGDFAGGAWQMAFAGACFWACALLFERPHETDFCEIPKTAWAALAYLVFFGSILAYSAYIWLLKARPAAEVGTHAYVNPVVAVILGAFAGGESVTPAQIAGLFLILSGVAAATLGFKSKPGNFSEK